MDRSSNPGIEAVATTTTRGSKKRKNNHKWEKENKQQSAESWLQAGLDVLNDEGINSVKVLLLAKKLGVTRGSFYWHFENREDLLHQMLAYWEVYLTDTVIDQAKQVSGSAQDKLRDVLNNVMLNRQERYDTAIIAWSRFDEAAAKCHTRVVRKRLRYLVSLLTETGMNSETARFRARVAYSLLVMTNEGLPRMSKLATAAEIDQCMELIFS